MSEIGTIDRAIRVRWDERGMEQAFRAYWPDPNLQTVSAFNSEQARSPSQDFMPYCVFQSMPGPSPGRSTNVPGLAQYEAEYRTIPIQFAIHATLRTVSGKRTSGKEICRALGKLLIAAYEDAAGPLTLDGDDCHIETVVGQDFHVRPDDDVWKWVFPFDVMIERRRRIRGVS